MGIDLGLWELTVSCGINRSSTDQKYPLLSFGILAPSLGFGRAHGCLSRENVVEWKWCVQLLGHGLYTYLLPLILLPLGKWWQLEQTLWRTDGRVCGGRLSLCTDLETSQYSRSRAAYSPGLSTYFWSLRETNVYLISTTEFSGLFVIVA